MKREAGTLLLVLNELGRARVGMGGLSVLTENEVKKPFDILTSRIYPTLLPHTKNTVDDHISQQHLDRSAGVLTHCVSRTTPALRARSIPFPPLGLAHMVLISSRIVSLNNRDVITVNT